MNYLMIDGKGDPRTAVDYKEAVEALYAAAYTIKMTYKKQHNVDFTVMPLEGLWWSANMEEFSLGARDKWEWTMMIVQPEVVEQSTACALLEDVFAKKQLPAIRKIRFERYDEGLSAQIMYTGAYQDEAPVIANMHKFIRESGYALGGKHHEIYIGDPRRTVPEKLKTVIRQPVLHQS